MTTLTPYSITLDNFEGPIDFLLHLIQKSEIDICAVSLTKITDQYLADLQKLMDARLDVGAEFIGSIASLLLWKSKALLPTQEDPLSSEETGVDPRFEMINQLIEYCRFKELAKELIKREDQQANFYGRGCEALPDFPKKLGIEHLSLEDLGKLFQQVLVKSLSQKRLIHEDVWQVSDKIDAIQECLKSSQRVPFSQLFSPNMCREELIVTFLALLELMKLGIARVILDRTTNTVMIDSHI